MLLNIRPVPAPNISGLTATPGVRSIVLTWDLPNDITYAGAEVWRGTVNDVTKAAKLASVSSNTWTDTGSTIDPINNMYYWVRAINIYGRTDGQWSNSVAVKSILATNLDIAAGAVKAANLAVAAIDPNSGNLTAGSVTTANLAAGAVTAEKIAANSITAQQISVDYVYAGTLDVAKINLGGVATPVGTAVNNATTTAGQAVTTAGNAVTTAGNAQTAATNAQKAAAAAAVATFAAGPGLAWDFTSATGVLGWYMENGGQINQYADFLTVVSANSDPMFSLNGLSFSGATYDKVRARVRRTGGTGWDGSLYANREGQDGYAHIADPTVASFNNWVILEWDLSTSSAWTSQTITHIRIDLGNTPQDVFDIDWIQVGRYGPTSLGTLGFTGDTNATNGAPTGTSVGGTAASLVASRAMNGDSAYTAINTPSSSLNTSIATAGTTAVYNNVSGRPQDVSNLVRKSDFSDLSVGGWGSVTVGAEVIGGSNSAAVPSKNQIVTNGRDALENDSDFPVTPGETVFFSAWLNTESTPYDGRFGFFVFDKNGTVVRYVSVTLSSGRAWSPVSSSTVIPPTGVTARPWLQQEGFDFNGKGYLRATNMWIGRYERGATVGAQSGVNLKNSAGQAVGDSDMLNSYSQFGPNLIPNSDFSSGLAGWGIDSTNRSVGWDYCNSAHVTMAGLGWAINGGVGEGCTVLQVHQPGDDGDNGASVNFEIYSPLIPVDTSKHYLFSAYTGAHRCKVDVLVAFYDVNGAYISTVYAPSNNAATGGGQYLAGYMRQQAPFVPPANAAAVRLIVYKWTTIAGQGDSWLMLARLMLQEVGGNTTVAGPWAPAGVSNQSAAQIADKISQTAGGVLQGGVLMQSSGAIVAGNASWSSPGYGGTGAVMSPYGFACVKNGVPTFAASVSGDVSFGGTLTGPSGTLGKLQLLDTLYGGSFTGWGWPSDPTKGGFAISALGAIFGNYNGGNGSYVSIEAGGNIDAPGFSLHNRQLTLTNPVIITPNINNPKVTTTFNVTLADVYITGQNNGTTITTGLVPAISGGSGNYSFQWSFSPRGIGGIQLSGGLGGSSLTVSANGSNSWKYGTASVTVKDNSTQATATAYCDIQIQFGNAAPQ